MGSQSPGLHLLQCGVIQGLQMVVYSSMDLHGLQEGSLVSPWSIPWAAGEYLLQYLLPLLFCWLQNCLSYTLPPHSDCGCTGIFSSFLNMLSQRCCHCRQGQAHLGASWNWSILEPAAVCSIGHWGSFWQLFTEATPVALSFQNLLIQTQYSVSFDTYR